MGDDGHDYHRLRSFRGTSSSSTESVGSYMSDGSYTNTSGQSLMMKWASRHSPVFAGSSRQSSGTRRGITTNNNTSAMDISIVQGGEDEDDYDSASASASASSGRNELGTINGVIVPCLLNILGVILFLRLGWSVGQAGWLGTLAIFGIAETQAILTVLSLSAIVTNGQMKGGGSYFLISRSLGPELGGAIGVLFYLAYAVGSTFYTIGFATEIQESFYPEFESRWFLIFLSSVVLLIILTISLLGAGFFTKINVLIFTIQFGSIVVAIVSMLSQPNMELEGGGSHYVPSFERFKRNALPAYTVDDECNSKLCSFRTVFAIIFPAATGIMEGANLSGDLKSPSKSIPFGTMRAILISIVVYLMLIVAMASSYDRDTLTGNPVLLQDTAWNKYLIIIGVLVSTSSSALGAIFGGSRVLQALAKDNLFPGLSWFGKGSGSANEPRRAVIFTWAVAQGCLFLGDLDDVAPIITSFFCLSYGITNFTCFLLRVSGVINFRPTYKYWSASLSLIGGILNLGIMFWINTLYASSAFFLLIVLAVYLAYQAPVVGWGDVSQALIYHQVRKYLFRLDQSEAAQGGKLWRPSILLLLDDKEIRHSYRLIDFCNTLKKGGLYILGHTLVGDFQLNTVAARDIKVHWFNFINNHKIKAFPQIAIAPDARTGYHSLIMTGGLGALEPNTVVLPYPYQLQQCSDGDDTCTRKGVYSGGGVGDGGGSDEFLHIMHDILTLRKNLVLSLNFDNNNNHDTMFADSGSDNTLDSAATIAAAAAVESEGGLAEGTSALSAKGHTRAHISSSSSTSTHHHQEHQQRQQHRHHDEADKYHVPAHVPLDSSVTDSSVSPPSPPPSTSPSLSPSSPRMQYDGTCAFLTLDVWLTSQTSIRTWDQFAAEALLLLQLAYVVVRNKNGVYVDKRNKRKSKLKLRIIRVLNLPVSWAPQHRSQFSGQRHLDKKDDGDGDGDSDNHTTINSASNNRSRHTTSCSDGRGVSRGFGNQADGRGQDFPRHSSSSAFIPLVLPPAAAQGDEDHTRLMNKLPQYPPTLHHDHGHSHSHSHSSASFSSPSSPSALHSSRVLRRIARERAALQALVLESRIDVQDIKIIVTYHDSDPATATATATNPHHHDDADSSTSMSINTHTNIHAGATPNIDITTRANGGSSHRTHSMSTSHTDDQSGHYDDATGDHECVNGNIDGTNTASHSVSSVSTKMQEAMHEPSSVPSFSSFPSPSSSSSFACPSYVAHLNHLMREESTQRVRRIPRPSDSHSQHAQDSYVNIAEENYSGDVLFQTYLIFASLPSPSIVIAAEGSGVESNDHGIDDGNTTSNTNDNRCDENSGSASSTDRNGGTNMEAASSDDGNSSGGSGDEDAGADDAQVKENEKKTEGREQTTSETKLFVDSISADDNQAGMEWKTNDGNVSCDKTLKGPGAWSVSRIGVGAESGTETDARESKGPVRVDMNASERYLRMIREMTMGLPPTSLVCAGSQRSLMSRDI